MKYIQFTNGILSARYTSEIHGAKRILIDDPDWERPSIDIDDQEWERPTQIGDDPEWQRPSINIVLQPGESGEQDGAPFTNETDEPIVIGTEPDLEAEAPQVELPDDSIPHPQVQVPDMEAIPEQIEVDNQNCKIPAEAIEVDDELFNRTINEQDGVWSLVDGDIVKLPIPDLSPEQALINASESVRIALQEAIDIKARELGFSGGNALMLYAGFVNPFQTLAQSFATWEATVWVEANEYKAEVIAGNETMLSGDEAVELMPELVIE